MNRFLQRAATVAGVGVASVALLSGTALAHECFNPNKKPLAGAQVVFSESGVTMKKGLETRVEKGLVDPETGEGFHGLIGFEFDGFAGTTFIVGKEGEIPDRAQDAGSECNGIVNGDSYLKNCGGGE